MIRATSAPASASAFSTTASTGTASTRPQDHPGRVVHARFHPRWDRRAGHVISPFRFEHGMTTLSVLGRPQSPACTWRPPGLQRGARRTEEDATEKPIEMVYWGMGAEWADSLGCDIISSSLGYNVFPDSVGTDITYPMLDGHTTIITRAAEIARGQRGILVVNSAGNDGSNPHVGRKISARVMRTATACWRWRPWTRSACAPASPRRAPATTDASSPTWRRRGCGAHGESGERLSERVPACQRHVLLGAARGRTRRLPHAGAADVAAGAHRAGAQNARRRRPRFPTRSWAGVFRTAWRRSATFRTRCTCPTRTGRSRCISPARIRSAWAAIVMPPCA